MDNEQCDYVLLMDDEYTTFADMDELLATYAIDEITSHNWRIYQLGAEIAVRENPQWKVREGGEWKNADE